MFMLKTQIALLGINSSIIYFYNTTKYFVEREYVEKYKKDKNSIKREKIWDIMEENKIKLMFKEPNETGVLMFILENITKITFIDKYDAVEEIILEPYRDFINKKTGMYEVSQKKQIKQIVMHFEKELVEPVILSVNYELM